MLELMLDDVMVKGLGLHWVGTKVFDLVDGLVMMSKDMQKVVSKE
jgi:hypothetical protein